MKELPKTYQPSSLKPPELEPIQIMYAIGIENAHHEFGMFDGPNPDLMEMLERIPDYEYTRTKKNIYLFQLNGTDDRPLYRWNRQKDLWELI